jgi:hypothetical protein
MDARYCGRCVRKRYQAKYHQHSKEVKEARAEIRTHNGFETINNSCYHCSFLQECTYLVKAGAPVRCETVTRDDLLRIDISKLPLTMRGKWRTRVEEAKLAIREKLERQNKK